jgi:hypothetical protein
VAGLISVLEGAVAAYGFAGRASARAAGAVGLAGLLGAGAGLALVDRSFGRAGALFAAYLLAATMARGALLRIALADRWDGPERTPGWSGFQWGRLEWRLLAVALLRALLFGLLAALLLTALATVYIGLAGAESGAGVAAPQHWRKTLDPTGWAVMSGLALAGGAGVIWTGLRLSPAAAVTAGLGRVQLLSVWPLTRGRVWRILGVLVLVLAPAAGLTLAGPGLMAAVGLAPHHSSIAAFALVAGLAQGLLALPLCVGLAAYLYERLDPVTAVQNVGAPR